MVCLATVPVLVACGPGDVGIDSPDLSGSAARTCRALVEALPDSLDDKPRRAVEPPDAYGAAYGDPAITVTCGVPDPADLDPEASCQRVDGVDWFVPVDQLADDRSDLVLTTVGRDVNVELVVPAQYRPPDGELVDIAQAVKAHTTASQPCL